MACSINQGRVSERKKDFCMISSTALFLRLSKGLSVFSGVNSSDTIDDMTCVRLHSGGKVLMISWHDDVWGASMRALENIFACQRSLKINCT